jgi:4a-hydroxytetrahydrobiopterin dehydratase
MHSFGGDDMTEQIGPKAFHEAGGTTAWRVISDGANAFFRSPSLAESAAFVLAIAGLPDLAGHPPDIDIRHDGVTVRLLTAADDYYGMTTGDVELAREISALARARGLMPDPSAIECLLIVPGAPDIQAIVPFWRAVLGYVPRPDSPDEDLVDAHDRNAGFWFEQMDEPRGDQGGAIHIAVWLAREHAEVRLAAALAAGGHLVRDRAPMWWTVADVYGNEVDISTTEGRG